MGEKLNTQNITDATVYRTNSVVTRALLYTHTKSQTPTTTINSTSREKRRYRETETETERERDRETEKINQNTRLSLTEQLVRVAD